MSARNEKVCQWGARNVSLPLQWKMGEGGAWEELEAGFWRAGFWMAGFGRAGFWRVGFVLGEIIIFINKLSSSNHH